MSDRQQNVKNECRPFEGKPVDFSHGPLRVTADGHHLEHEDGTPFFYLADTAWELFGRLSREEADMYLENRRQKGFTAIQAVIISELDDIGPNYYGDVQLIDRNPLTPNEKYFEHVDYIIDKAAEKGMYIVALPVWGEWVTSRYSAPVFTTGEQGYSFGWYLGNRYRDRNNIIWCLGGDRHADESEWGYDVWRSMAEGLADGTNGKKFRDGKPDYSGTLMTYHAYGSSSEYFHKDPWIDFHMWGSYHMERNAPKSYEQAEKDYNLPNPKPTLNGEPCYENHPVNWKPELGYFDDFDVRQAAYWSLFAGTLGHTYGCSDIWQMACSRYQPVGHARNTWTDTLDLQGAWDMLHMRRLMESRPFTLLTPDQSLIVGEAGSGEGHIRAARASNGSYAMVYIPTGSKVDIDLSKFTGTRIKAYWFDPREGTSNCIGTFKHGITASFDPPSSGRGNDWVLVLDDETRGFSIPGAF